MKEFKNIKYRIKPFEYRIEGRVYKLYNSEKGKDICLATPDLGGLRRLLRFEETPVDIFAEKREDGFYYAVNIDRSELEEPYFDETTKEGALSFVLEGLGLDAMAKDALKGNHLERHACIAINQTRKRVGVEQAAKLKCSLIQAGFRIK